MFDRFGLDVWGTWGPCQLIASCQMTGISKSITVPERVLDTIRSSGAGPAALLSISNLFRPMVGVLNVGRTLLHGLGHLHSWRSTIHLQGCQPSIEAFRTYADSERTADSVITLPYARQRASRAR